MNQSFLQLIEEIDSSSLSRYLLEYKWKKIKLKKNISYEIYINKKDNVQYQINVPLRKEYSDYNSLMISACLKLSEFEDVEPSLMIWKILNPHSDIIKIRAKNENVVNGTLPLDDALKLIEQSKKILTDAAMDVFCKTKHRVSKFPSNVTDFISRCRFGQTEVGSYVLSIICPFEQEKSNLVQVSIFDNDEFIEENSTRKVVKKLLKSTKQISEAIDNNINLETFINKSDDDFISLNFIEDLSDFIGNDDEAIIEIKSEMDKSLGNNESSESIIFKTNNNIKIKRFIEEYKAKENDSENHEKCIIGFISKVAADPILDQRHFGEITVESLLDKKTYHIKLNLEDYIRAIESHQKGWKIKVTGIEVDGMIECSKFEELDNSLF